MSRREARDSDSKRHRSRFDREPSPKRSRRDGRPATDKPSGNDELGSKNHSDRDQKPHLRPQDALPVEVPLAPDSKVETQVVNKETDKKNVVPHEGTKRSSGPTEAPRPRTYFQHDERGDAGQVDRRFSRGAATERTERGWWRDSSKDRHRERERATTNRTVTSDSRQKDEKPTQAEDGAWRHDGFFKMEEEADVPPAAATRKRPSFREKKIPPPSENAADKAETEPVKDHRPVLTGRRESTRQSDRLERPFADRRGDGQRNSGFSSARDSSRYGIGNGNGNNYRAGGGRERFNNGGRQGGGYRPQGQGGGGVRVEKWKHDMYNRSPTPPENEEDQIAKIEALLASK